MTNQFNLTPLILAINTILFMSTSAYADEGSEEMPIAVLPTMTVYSQSDSLSEEKSYTAPQSSAATGLALTMKQTPKAVTVITEQRIKDQQLKTVKDIVDATPGIAVQHIDGSRAEFFARGFKIDDFSVDGMPVSYATLWGEGAELSSAAIYEHVDIVKGANGLMSGSGNPSATINVTRKHADSTQFSGEISASYDKFGTYDATVDVGSRLNQSGTIRGRVISHYSAGDTYIDREEKSNKTAYAVIDADLSANTTVSLGGMHQEKIQDQVMWGGLPVYYTDGEKIDWDTHQSTSTNWDKRDGITDEVFASMDHDFNQDWHLKVSANHAKTDADMKLFYVDGYVYRPNGLVVGGINPNTGAPTPAVPYTTIWQTDTTDTNVLAEVSGAFEAWGHKHQLMMGADFNDYKTITTPRNGIALQPVVGVVNDWDGSYIEPTWGEAYERENYGIKEYALYGSTRLQLTDALALLLGSRVSNYKKQGKVYLTDLDIEHESVWTPFVGITYDINDNSSVFASYTDVFNPQEQRDVKGDYLEPIVGKNLEVGFKANNDADTLQAQFSVFRIEQDNLAQIDAGKTVEGAPIEQAYYAAQGAKSTGIDVEVTGQMNDYLKAGIGYTQFSATDSEGRRINTQSPDTLIKLFAVYDMSRYVPGLSLGGGVNWMGDRYVDFANQLKGGAIEKLAEDPVTLVNLMAKYEVNDHLDLQVNLNNALNEKYIQSFGFNQITMAEPLNIGGKITYKW